MMPTSPVVVIDGRYRVLNRLFGGGGAGGEVYEVFDDHLGEVAVLKFVHNIPAGSPWHESRILRMLADPHILPIRNAAVASSGVPYVVTERATHGTLDAQFGSTAGIGLGARSVITWMCQTALGAARAHGSNLIHNDIKPANIFLNAEGEALLGDFGGASLIPPTATSAIPLQATAETMAPEVAVGWGTPAATASIASDVYSLGATTFWLLAGGPAHDFGTAVGFDARRVVVASNALRRLRDVAPHIPMSVASVVDRATAVDPTGRYATSLEFAAALSSRVLPRREWHRTNAHPLHLGCWVGDIAHGGSYCLCIEPGTSPTRCDVVVTHARSGRRISGECRSTPLRSWPQAVRATIQRLG